MHNKKELVLLREGYCLRCGMCCVLGHLAETPAFKKVSKSESLEKFISENNTDEVYCKHYNREDKSCKVFNQPERPEACVNHPGSPNSVIPGCGYKFKFKRVSKLELERLEQDEHVKVFKRKRNQKSNPTSI